MNYKVLQRIGEVVSKFKEIEIAYAFGSFLKRKDFNDVDVALLVSHRFSPYEVIKFEMQVARELEREIKPRCKFDVKMLNSSPITFQYRVLKEGGVTFSKDEAKRTGYEARVLSNYLDWKETSDWLDENFLRNEIPNKEEIIEHLREIDEALKDWERYQAISLDELRLDRDKRNMVLHALLISIQSAIDIANHLIAGGNLRKPSTYREAFEILYEEGIISSELVDGLSDLAGFRNVLTHIYWRLDLERVHGILQKDLEVLKRFKEIMKKLLRT